MADYINVNVNVGDLLPDPAFPHLGPRDGYVIDFQDPDEYDPVYGTKHKETYAVLQLPKNPFLRYLKENIEPIEKDRKSDPRTDIDSRYSGVMMPLSSLASEAGSSDLVSKWRSKDKIPIVDLRHVNSIGRIARSTRLDVIDARARRADLNAISSGNYTIGSAQDYATIAAFVADIIALTGNLTGDIRTVITETGQSNFTADIGAYNFRLYDSDDHNGNILSAKRITSTYTDHLIRINLPAGSTGEFKIDGFEIYSTALTGNVNIAQIHIQVGLNASIIIDNMFLHSGGSYDATAINPWANGTHRILRSTIWNIPYGIVVFSNGVPDIENSLIYNCSAIGLYGGNKACTLRNVNSFDSGTTDFSLIGSAIVNNCASTDDTADDGGSGSGNLINLTASNEAYLDDTKSNFGRPKLGGSIKNSGSTPLYSSNDMAGVAWTVPPPIGPLNLDTAGINNLRGNIGHLLQGGLQ